MDQNSLSKDAVAAAIARQYGQQAPQGGMGLLGVPGTPRDPAAMRARMEYTKYAEQMMQQGQQPMPFEAWQRQNLAPPQPQSRGLLDFFR